jgi:hypothetical protein
LGVRVLLAIGLVFALGGCIVAIPPAVTIASYAVDGISYIATGKTLTDHAISGAAGEDCVLMRAASLKNPCRDYFIPDSELAVELETSYGGEEVSTELAEADLAAGDNVPTLGRGKRGNPAMLASAAKAQPAAAARYVVVGSFRDRGNAERARRAHAASGAAIVPASVRGQSYYRVVTPQTAARPDEPVRWTIARCAGGAAAADPPCLDRAGMESLRGPATPRPDVVERAAAPLDREISDRSAGVRLVASGG